jgi:hypothetical protein
VPAGHIDLLVGRNAPRTTWPILEAWLGRRLGARAAAQQPGPTQPAPTQPQAEQAETPPGSAE